MATKTQAVASEHRLTRAATPPSFAPMEPLRSAARAVILAMRRVALALVAPVTDRRYQLPDIPPPDLTRHATLGLKVIEAGAKPGLRVLEIGAREVTGSYGLRERLAPATYVGFDYYPGPNVDVAGDAHRLSSYFDEPFDVVYSTAVLEHLAMPWVAAEEIAKVMKPGGLLFLETHFSFSAHERPWHFFQFSDEGLKVLFGPATGFEVIEAALQNPIVGRFSHQADAYLRYRPVGGLYCHATIIARKVRDVPDFDWRDVAVADAVGGTQYPKPVG